MVILQILSLFIWMGIVPLGLGLWLCERQKELKAGDCLLFGFFCSFALFELLGIPIVLLVTYHGFSLLAALFGVLTAAGAVRGYYGLFKKDRDNAENIFSAGRFWRDSDREEKLLLLLFGLLLLFQLYMAFTRTSFDGDDAYYGVQGLAALQQDSLYRFDAYTGRSTPLDLRHALALLPIWEAFLAKMSGFPMAVTAHSIMPLLLIPLTYLLYGRIAEHLLENKKQRIVFLIFMEVFQIFGNVSIYTNETFFLTRTWQGKSLAGNLILPAVFWLMLLLFKRGRLPKEAENFYFRMLGILTLAAGIGSSLAVLLCVFLTAGLSALFALRERRIGILLKAGAACLPGGAYILVYLLASH